MSIEVVLSRLEFMLGSTHMLQCLIDVWMPFWSRRRCRTGSHSCCGSRSGRSSRCLGLHDRRRQSQRHHYCSCDHGSVTQKFLHLSSSSEFSAHGRKRLNFFLATITPNRSSRTRDLAQV